MIKTVVKSILVLALLSSTCAVGAGLTYAVSLEKAREIVRSDSSKHILIFYTEGW